MVLSYLDWIVQCFTSPPTQYRLLSTSLIQLVVQQAKNAKIKAAKIIS